MAKSPKKDVAKNKPPTQSSSHSAKKPATGKRRVVRFITYWAAVAGIWIIVGLTGIVAWYAYELPDMRGPGEGPAGLSATRGPEVSLTYADGSPLITVGGAWGEEVPWDALPKSLIDAVVATEDRRFFSHVGLDVLGLARALFVNVTAGRVVQGGSTITQQLAKNVFLTPERSLRRKLLEAMMALWLEARYSKKEILGLYLNRVYLGAGAYGVDAAARRYFGVPAARLSLPQSAILAGLLKAPSRYAPSHNKQAAIRRTRIVLSNMVAAELLEPAAAEKARSQLSRIVGRVKKSTTRSRAASARYFSDWVFEQLADYVSQTGQQVTVRTTLDRHLQAVAETTLRRGLDGEGKKRNADQAALVTMDANGAVRALVGGKSYEQSQFNRAVQARRHAGSTFKLFVYLAALEKGLSPETKMIDGPVTVENWSPRNFSDYKGPVTIGQGLAWSLNSIAVKVSQRTGLKPVIDAARRLGLTGKMAPHPSLALGAAEVSPLEMTSAYAAVATGGIGVFPYAISEIKNARGDVIYRRQGEGPGRVMSAETAAQLTAMLTTAVKSGTGRNARLKRPAAGKTGTSQNYRDAWFVGFTANYITGIWVGNDNGSPTSKITGGGLPARMWQTFMRAAHSKIAARPLTAARRKEPGGWFEKLVSGSGGGAGSDSQPTMEDSIGRGEVGQ
jgi:penicillin-binding protein 1A